MGVSEQRHPRNAGHSESILLRGDEMFFGVWLIRALWRELYADMNMVGKVVLLPLFLLLTIALFVFAFCETISIDLILVVLSLFSRTMSISNLFDAFWFD